jgi:hypothetical protein
LVGTDGSLSTAPTSASISITATTKAAQVNILSWSVQ